VSELRENIFKNITTARRTKPLQQSPIFERKEEKYFPIFNA